MARRSPAIDRDGGALDVPSALGAQKQRERRDVLGLAEAARVALGERLRAQLVDRPTQRRRALPAQLLLPLGVGIAGMNDVDVDVIAIAELRQALGKVGDRRVDRAADQKFGIGGACGAPDDVDDASLRSLQHRPEQPGEPHAAEELQREAVEPDRIGQIQERARARRARVVDEHVATLEAFVDAAEQLLARLELAQTAAAKAVAAEGPQPLTVAGDLRKLEACEQLFRRVNERFERCDVLVNNAGATRAGAFLDLPDAVWLDGFALKFFGCVRLTRLFWPLLKASQGSVINIVGGAARTPDAEFLIGGSVNAAVANFSKGLSKLGN